MKRAVTLFLLVSISFFANAQAFYDYFTVTETLPCPYNNNATVTWPQHWTIYQTLNDRWDGPVDSSRCISVSIVSQLARINLEQIDPAKSLFLRRKNDPMPVLPSNGIHSATTTIRYPSDLMVNHSDSCGGLPCSALIAQVDIPDSVGAGRNIRQHETGIPPGFVSQNIALTSTELCFPTEYFPDNHLKEMVLQFRFDNADLTGKWIDMQGVSFEINYDPYLIDQINIPIANCNDNICDYSFWDNPDYFAEPVLIQYGSSAYPSVFSPYYVEAAPTPNTPTPKVLNIYSIDSPIQFQPFTYLRGGLVEGSSDERHTVNLINDGFDLCLYAIVDLIFDGDVHYLHRGGGIHFSGINSCMQFRNGGSLDVADNTTLYYGNDGHGILALRTGATIKLGRNSKLVIDNTLHFFERATDTAPQQIYMELNPGSTLAFGPHARVINHYSIDGSIRLNVYMNGGILDDSELSPEERQLIRRIYPEPTGRFSDDVRVYPSPAKETLHWSLVTAEDGTPVQWRIRDLNGRILQKGVETGVKGYNEWEIRLDNIATGYYLLEVQSEQIHGTKAWVKQ